MRTLVIPDVHLKIHIVEDLLANLKYDEVVFLGDFFDDWVETPALNEYMAERVKEWLWKDNYTCILGNHDMSYFLGGPFRCSGWSKEKEILIKRVLTDADWQRFVLHKWVRHEGKLPWLLTHAGVQLDALRSPANIDDLDSICETALKSMRDPIVALRGFQQPILRAGRSRGGDAPVGGINWMDFSEFTQWNVPYDINQLVGHTFGKDVREKIYYNDVTMQEYKVVCIDTALRECAMIEDGELKIIKIKEKERE